MCKILRSSFQSLSRQISHSNCLSPKSEIVKVECAKRFVEECFKKIGTCAEHAEIMANSIIEADMRGRHSHGINRLEFYLDSVREGQTDPNAKPAIEEGSIATNVVNGNKGFGPVVGKYCMDLAIEKAKRAGVSMIVAHSSNHFGIAAVYCLQAMKERLVGCCCSNTSNITNLVGFGACTDDDSIIVDTKISLPALETIQLVAHEDKTHNPTILNQTQKLPISEETGTNHTQKGFKIWMIIQILTSLSSFTIPNILQSSNSKTDKLDIGHCFIAIDPEAFVPCFEERLKCFLSRIRELSLKNPDVPIFVPGDLEKMLKNKVERDGGLTYNESQLKNCETLAKELGVPNIKI